MEKYLAQIETFSIKSENHICFIDFSGPSSKNAVSLAIASTLKKVLCVNEKTHQTIFEDFLKKEKIAVIVIRSLVENIFSSGGHLLDLSRPPTPEHLTYGTSVRDFCQLFTKLSIPSIALLTGNAYGGGVELALAPDFRWSIGKNIAFHFAQARLGVPGGWAGMTRLTELNSIFTPKKVSSLFIAQDIFHFEDLIRFSLIDKVFNDETSCYAELFRWRDNILTCDEKLKCDFYQRTTISPDQLAEHDVEFFQKYFLSENHKKNINTFLKRKKNHDI